MLAAGCAIEAYEIYQRIKTLRKLRQALPIVLAGFLFTLGKGSCILLISMSYMDK